jgi:ubiquinone/menaquinone biosynthesis C-methylase UbiE
MKKMQKEIRNIFHQIHQSQLLVKTQYNRTKSLSTTTHLGVEENFFQDKICLEAGCGTFAPASQNMLKGGAKKVYSLDLDESIFEIAPRLLSDWEKKYELVTGSVLDLPFPDEYFDFVICDGVLHCTGDIDKGLSEICRVVKSGGSIYISTMGEGGVMKEFEIILRERYKTDEWFRSFIDNLDSRTVIELFLLAQRGNNSDANDEECLENVTALQNLLDDDLCLTIKDRIQSPLYDTISVRALLKALSELSITNICRISHPIQFYNIRRYLAPYYYDYSHPVAKFLYGDGYLQVFGTKK